MSKMEIPKKVSKKPLKIHVYEHNAAEIEKVAKKSVTIIFLFFFGKGLRNFFCFIFMDILGNDFTQKNPILFTCEDCDFNTSSKKDYKRHLDTIKHKNNKWKSLETIFTPKNPKYVCVCGNMYVNNSGLWKHKKKCQPKNVQKNVQKKDDTKTQELVEYLSKENSELKSLIITTLQEQNKNIVELAKNAGHNTTNNTTNNNNQRFNLHFYLNDTCKDAMNIMDFVSQLDVGIKDLEETGRLGFAEGITKIIINGLNQIQTNDRPIHCSDSKRETLYIRNNDEWTKEGEDKLLLTNAIKHVAHKNMKQIFEWTKDHPEYNDPDSRENDRYLQIVSEAMSGATKEECVKNYNKIIKNIAKETVIEK